MMGDDYGDEDEGGAGVAGVGGAGGPGGLGNYNISPEAMQAINALV